MGTDAEALATALFYLVENREALLQGLPTSNYTVSLLLALSRTLL